MRLPRSGVSGAFAISIAVAALLVAPGSSAGDGDQRPLRRAIAPASSDGWARVMVGGDATRAMATVWIGDEAGKSVPFTLEREGLWASRALPLHHVSIGRGEHGQTVVDFELLDSTDIDRRDREQLTVKLRADSDGEWVERVQVAWARTAKGAPVAEPTQMSRYVFNLGSAGRHEEIVIPWVASRGRIILDAVQGRAPTIRGIEVTAGTDPRLIDAEVVLPAKVTPISATASQLEIVSVDRIVGLDVLLDPPIAPVRPEVTSPLSSTRIGAPDAGEEAVRSSGVLWNIPALDAVQTRIDVGPVVASRLTLVLPPGATVARAAAVVRHEALLFPAERGRKYFLHIGGSAKPSPGSLFALPSSSRVIYEHAPLGLGEPEADPDATPLPEKAADLSAPKSRGLLDRAERALPWATGATVLLLGYFAWRLFERGRDGGAPP